MANRRVMIPSRCRLQERFKRPGSFHQSTRVETRGWENAREEEGKRTLRLTKICVMPCTALKVRCLFDRGQFEQGMQCNALSRLLQT